jgi:hypothetical protein
MSGLFAAVTVFIVVLFVRALTEKEIRTGLLTFAIFTAATTIGMWRIRRWGRSLALVVAIGNVGLGALALLAVLISREGGWIGPAILLVTSLGLGYVLGRPIFNLDDDYR